MLKLERVLENKNMSPYILTEITGDQSRSMSLQRVFNKEIDITGLSQEALQGIARGLGVQIEDIMEDFDFDGTTGQISTLKRMIERFRKRITKLTEKEIKESHMIVQSKYDQVRYNDPDLTEHLKNFDIGFNGKDKLNRFYEKDGFVFAINVDKLEFGGGSVLNPFPLSKKKYDFLDSKLAHSEQDIPNVADLNIKYLEESQVWSSRSKNQPLSINTIANKKINNCSAIVIYNPMNNGGDFKIALSVFDFRGNVELSEVYGVEWIDRDDNKSIAYYKSQFFEPINKNIIRTCEKHIISEIEFYKGIHSQFRKFKVKK